ncbi:MAG: hypothetical protein AB2A00_20785 [Myxococcota bacterium]
MTTVDTAGHGVALLVDVRRHPGSRRHHESPRVDEQGWPVYDVGFLPLGGLRP